MKNILRTLRIQSSACIDRFIILSGYKIGCWRSVSQQLKVIDEYTDLDLEKEVELLKNICDETELDTDYLKNAVKIRLSAAVIRYLMNAGYDRKDVMISSNPDTLKKMIEEWAKISIDETSCGFNFNGKSGCYWNTPCDLPMKKRFQLFAIIRFLKNRD